MVMDLAGSEDCIEVEYEIDLYDFFASKVKKLKTFFFEVFIHLIASAARRREAPARSELYRQGVCEEKIRTSCTLIL